jgi:hypothetical protein
LPREPLADRLDGVGRERLDGAGTSRGRLADGTSGVRGEAVPLAGALEHALEQRHRLADRRSPYALGFELEAESRDDRGRDLAQPQGPEPRQHVRVPEDRVDLQRARGQVRLSVELPPLLAELGERLLAGVERRQLAGPSLAAQLGVEGLGVALAAEDLGAVLARLAPAHAPDDTAVLSFDPLDAHGVSSRRARSERKLPAAGGGGTRGYVVTGSGTRTTQRSTHSSNAARGIRRREHNRAARSSPRSIAR